MICYGCQEPGHHVRDCPKASKDIRPHIHQAGSGFSSQSKFGQGVNRKRGREFEVEASAADEDGLVDDDESVRARLKLLLTRVGDKSKATVEQNLSMLSAALADGDVVTHADFMCRTMLQCVQALPAKTHVYACLVGLLNSANPAFGAQLVSAVAAALDAALLAPSSSSSYDVRLLVRFLGLLAANKAADANEFLALLEQLLDSIASQQLGSIAADVCVYTIVSALPWAGSVLADHEGGVALGALMDKLGRHMQDRLSDSRHHINSKLYQLQDTDNAAVLDVRVEDLLANYWNAVRVMQEAQWQADTIVDLPASFKDELSETVAHKFSIAPIPPQAGAVAGLRADLRLYHADMQLDKGIKQGVDRLVVADHINDLLSSFRDIPKDCIKALLAIPANFDYHHLLVETSIASLLFTPCGPPHHATLYASVFIYLFKALPLKIPPLVGRAINALFKATHTLDVQVLDEFAQWFSLHLSNFGYRWPWANWEHALETPAASAQQCFIRQSLALCMRLSFRKRLEETVSPALLPLLPVQPDPAWVFSKASLEGLEGAARAAQETKRNAAEDVYDLVRSKNMDGARELLKEQLDNDDDRVHVLAMAVLRAGSQSLSHLNAILSRAAATLAVFKKGKEGQLRVLGAVLDTWKTSPQHIIIVVQALERERVVSPAVVLEWVFQQSCFEESWMWALLMGSVGRTLVKIDAGLAQLERQVGLCDKAGNEAKKTSATKALTTLTGQKKEMFVMVCTRFKAALETAAATDGGALTAWVEGRFCHFLRQFRGPVTAYFEDVDAALGGASSESVWASLSTVFRASA